MKLLVSISFIIIIAVGTGECVKVNKNTSISEVKILHTRLGITYFDFMDKLTPLLNYFPLYKHYICIWEAAAALYKATISIVMGTDNRTCEHWGKAFETFRTAFYQCLERLKCYLKTNKDCVLSEMVLNYVRKAEIAVKDEYDPIIIEYSR